MSTAGEDVSRRQEYLPVIDPDRRGVVESKGGRPRSAPFKDASNTAATKMGMESPRLPSISSGSNVVGSTSGIEMPDRDSRSSSKVMDKKSAGQSRASSSTVATADANSGANKNQGAHSASISAAQAAPLEVQLGSLGMGMFQSTSDAGPAARVATGVRSSNAVASKDAEFATAQASAAQPAKAGHDPSASAMSRVQGAGSAHGQGASQGSQVAGAKERGTLAGNRESKVDEQGKIGRGTAPTPKRDSKRGSPPPAQGQQEQEMAQVADRVVKFKKQNIPVPGEVGNVKNPTKPRPADVELAAKRLPDESELSGAEDLIRRDGGNNIKDRSSAASKDAREEGELELHHRGALLRFVAKPPRDDLDKPNGGPNLVAKEGELSLEERAQTALAEASVMAMREEVGGGKGWRQGVGRRSDIFVVKMTGESADSAQQDVGKGGGAAGAREYGFEGSLSHCMHRLQGIQLEDKDLSFTNVQKPTAGWAASQAKRPRRMGTEGKRAPAKDTISVAQSVKLPRQEGHLVDRGKEDDDTLRTLPAGRSHALDEDRVTLTMELTEEPRGAGKVVKVSSVDDKTNDGGYDALDQRPSMQEARTGEKVALYDCTKAVGEESAREQEAIAAGIRQSGLRRKGLRVYVSDRSKGAGEDKTRAPFY